MADYLIYGANGYTGELIAREAVRRGQRPVLAGRRRESIEPLAGELGLEHRVFSLDEPRELDAGIGGAQAVLHCAGPFSRTARPMADACVRTRAHYLDVTGEIEVFEALAAKDEQARDAGIMLMPGVGFDVVPSDCLAAHLKRRLPTATHLTLAFRGIGRLSRGTATTMAENFHRGGLVRRDGALTPVPAAWKSRWIDFGTGPRKAITIPWGDVATAYRSTGIPNIEVYMAAPFGMRLGARLSRYFGWALGTGFVQGLLKKRIQSGPPGPTEEERKRGKSALWGEVTDAAGGRASARLLGPEGYELTVLAALAVMERVLQGQSIPGYQTPAKAFGPDFILTIPSVTREDLGV